MYLLPLDEKLASEEIREFDASAYVDGMWTDLQTAYNGAVEINSLFDKLRQDPAQTFSQESNALGIGNIGYFKVKGEGVVQEVNENNVIILAGDQNVEIETEFIFGNAIRDASGLIRINDFDKTSDLNSISESINEKVRKQLIPDFRTKVKKGDHISFQGAIELNKAHLDLNEPEIIPISLQIVP